MPAPYSPDLRHRVLDACEAHQTTFKNIAKQYDVSEATIHNWRKAEREEGRREAKPHAGGPARKLGEADEAVLAALVEEQNDSTLEEYATALHERTGKRVSDSTISVVLRRLRLPRKKTLHASERDRPELVAERKTYLETVRPIPIEDFVFLDETGITTKMTRLYGRALKGERAHGSAPSNYKKLSIVGAMTVTGICAAMTLECTADTACFEAFVREFLVPSLRPGQVVVLDNLKPHKSAKVRKLVEDAGCRLLFLPRYSPELNPIEECWSKIKALLRALGARSLDALHAALGSVLEQVTAADARGWFKHCGYANS